MSTLSSANTSLAVSIICYESGELPDAEVIDFFQELIDTGQAWQLNGSYGRTAMSLIKSGKCMLGTKGFTDAYGNYAPSRDEVAPGTPGSAEFLLNNLDA
jgi:hypothetical protein